MQIFLSEAFLLWGFVFVCFGKIDFLHAALQLHASAEASYYT
jgi:hypothetical protein